MSSDEWIVIINIQNYYELVFILAICCVWCFLSPLFLRKCVSLIYFSLRSLLDVLFLTLILSIHPNMLCRTSLVITNSFSQLLSQKVFLSPTIKTDQCTWHIQLGWQLSPFRSLSKPFLISKFWLKNQKWFLCLSLYVPWPFSLAVFST